MIQTLRIHPLDNEGFENLLKDLGCPEGTTVEQLRIKSMLQPRESFKQVASKVAKVHIKQWPFLESLIVEKVRRRSSAMKSDVSSDEGSTHHFSGLGAGHGIGKKELRSNSYQVDNPIEEVD